MTCPKCAGLIVATLEEEDPARCLQCGFRPILPASPPLPNTRLGRGHGPRLPEVMEVEE
jgi:DNA-directed RNA polymerase subunit RPC12/RpoP